MSNMYFYASSWFSISVGLETSCFQFSLKYIFIRQYAFLQVYRKGKHKALFNVICTYESLL